MTTGGNCGLVIGRRQGNQRTRNNDMFKKVAGTMAALTVIFALGLLFGLLAYRWYAARGAGGYSGPALLVKVQTLSQFVTVKYSLEKVVEYDDATWYPYGDSRVVLVAHGVVKAGIDLSR